MKANALKRLVVVHSKKSSQAKLIQQEVLGQLTAAGISYETFVMPALNTLGNIEAVFKQARPGDRWLVAGGDGTANVVVNGLLRADQPDVTVGFLGYGNFNDAARTFNGRKSLHSAVSLATSQRTTELRPIEVLVDGKHLRYAELYVTIGWTAQAAHQFDSIEARRKLESSGTSTVSSLLTLSQYYFKERQRSFLPPFSRSGGQVHSQTTDILAVNGPIMARVIKSGRQMYAEPSFLSHDLDVSDLIKNCGFLVASVLGHMPGESVASDEIRFVITSDVPIQLDGEYIVLKDVTSLTIKKFDTSPRLQVVLG